MADDDNLRHSRLIYEVIAGSWTTAGENVGYCPSIGVVRVGHVLWTGHPFAG
jgi:hypothetical protein